jgi:BMFP domain-containing protein YqiC
VHIEEFTRDLGERLAGIFPSEQRSNIRALVADQVQAFFAQSRLVPRQEFDRYVEEVRNLEAAVDGLEARIAALEPSGAAAGNNSESSSENQ